MLNLEEYRYLDGWSHDKRGGPLGSTVFPRELVEEVSIMSLEDYKLLIPELLEAKFTTRDFKRASGLPLHASQTALNILYFVGAVDRVGKKGNAYIYSRV